MNKKFMQKAINRAKKAEVEIPVGAVIVKNDKIVATAFNQKEAKNDVTAHAEIVAIKKAARKLKNWRLDDCEIYVTLEPCPMCAWAILQSRMKAVYFGSYDIQYGAIESRLNLGQLSNINPIIKGGIMEEECDKLLNDFFEKVRNDNKK